MNPLALLSGLPVKFYEILGVVLALAAFGGYMYHRGGIGPRAERDAVQARFDAFSAQIKAIGDEAQKAADAKEKADKLAKKEADAKAAKSQADLDKLYAAYRKLHQQSASSPGKDKLPAESTFTPSAARSCFDSAKFVAAMGNLEAGILQILERGDSAISALDVARDWAKQQ